MNYWKIAALSVGSGCFSIAIWFGLTTAINYYNAELLSTLEPLLSAIFQLFLGLLVGFFAVFYEYTATEGLASVPLTILIVMVFTRLAYIEFGAFDLGNFVLNFVIYLPVALIAFFATWTFMKQYGKT